MDRGGRGVPDPGDAVGHGHGLAFPASIAHCVGRTLRRTGRSSSAAGAYVLPETKTRTLSSDAHWYRRHGCRWTVASLRTAPRVTHVHVERGPRLQFPAHGDNVPRCAAGGRVPMTMVAFGRPVVEREPETCYRPRPRPGWNATARVAATATCRAASTATAGSERANSQAATRIGANETKRPTPSTAR